MGSNLPGMTDNSPQQALAVRVRRDLEAAGLSDAEAARVTHIARETLRRKLAGVGEFSTSQLSALAKATGADLVEWIAEYQQNLQAAS